MATTQHRHWLRLANRTAIVTGAASGIGQAVVTTLQEAGCRLVCVDQHAVGPKNDDTTISLQCNVACEDQVESVVFGGSNTDMANEASILVNCAGITRDGWTKDMTMEDWNSVLQVNLTGTFLMCRGFIRTRNTSATSSNSPASIINIGSVVSEYGNLGQANYAASKGGVVGLTRALAKETARQGIRVNAVLPGFIATPMSQSVPPPVLESIQHRISLQGRLGQPDDVANLVAFLASERSAYMTGETIECSGMIAL